MKKAHAPDRIEKLSCGSVIQHGKYNNRIYLLKWGDHATGGLPFDLIQKAKRCGYSKVFAKVPSNCADFFFQAGYNVEASIPRFYNGLERCFFMMYYLKRRDSEVDALTFDSILQLACSKTQTSVTPPNENQFVLRRCDESDIDKMAAIYRTVFPTYPFPIYDPSYLLETMHSHVVYFGAEAEGELVALSSAEIDTSANNVEMTDFAALLKWQRNSLSGHLLLRMEEEMKRQGIKTAYTIARAMSPGINITFSKLGYTYGGRLINNTNISAHIESMNVWYKMMS